MTLPASVPGDDGRIRAAAAVALYLGDAIDLERPSSLLGLEGQGPWTDVQIVDALHARLRLIGEHPHRSAPQADELRMALHAAASKLLTSDRSAAFQPREPVMPDDFRAQVMAVVAAGGGWSREVMRHVVALGAERGIDPTQLAAWLATLQHGGGSPTTGNRPRPVVAGRSVLDPDPAPVDPSRGVIVLIGWLLGGLLSLLGVAAVVIVVVSMRPSPGSSSASPSPAPATGPSQSPASSPVAAAPAATPGDVPPRPLNATSMPATSSTPTPAPPTHVAEWPDLVRDLETATAAIRGGERGGPEAFSHAYAMLGDAWPSALADERIRAVDAVIDAVYAGAARQQEGPGVLDAIADHAPGGTNPPAASQLVGSVWTAGVVARLARERDLPQAMVRRVEALVSQIFGPGGVGETTFDQGVSAWLRSLAASMVARDATSDPAMIDARVQAWGKWLEAAKASQAVSPASLVLAAMDRIMLTGPDPSQDEATFRTLTELACAVAWRAEDPSRAWLLAKFDQPAIHADDLHVITRALATRSGAPGVDATMVLRADARDDERARVRAQYASAWAGRPAPSKATTHEAWLKAAARELESPAADTVAGRAVRAVAMARLCQGASMLAAAGLDESRAAAAAGEVDLLLLDLDAGLEKRVASLATSMRPSILRRESTAWVVQFVAAQQRISERLQLLSTFSDTPTLMEARLLVETAFRGSPERVQSEAQTTLKRRGSDVAVAAAMLEFAPFIAATPRNAELLKTVIGIDSLPSPRHSSWPVALRRALVERTLELLAGDGIDAIADAIGATLADAYAGRLAPSGGGDRTMPAEQAVEQVAAAAIREAQSLVPTGREPLSIAAILRNKEARERLAAGRVQVFAARQVTLVELMAYATCCEFPARADRVAEILASNLEQRRKAAHVLDQIASSERVMLELWVMRLGDADRENAS